MAKGQSHTKGQYDPGRQWLLTQMRDPNLPIEDRVQFATALLDLNYYLWTQGYDTKPDLDEMYRYITGQVARSVDQGDIDLSKILRVYGH